MLPTIRADVLVFKTNLRLKKDLKRISANISKEPRIKLWHVDTADTDKVLRIEAVDISATDIIQLIEQAGYQCAELPDE
ncbi:hypothetical protein GXP67_26510 [Rhodocytophaga rosea]|uniref:Copper chaperone n=1 Tax=Rhodocytophaga rosea TaxID=2704465 RepID=A0A6C0GPF8_9BACT|nr:hypothetical protein [Rhodocytophaga rosea]QHT69945.1 hypothetical protein GXP67_26510 [Rhodocytophaga rosea]